MFGRRLCACACEIEGHFALLRRAPYSMGDKPCPGAPRSSLPLLCGRIMVMDASSLGPVSLDRMVRAVEKVRKRLLRAAAALEDAGVPYAVVGGNAVAAWVSRVDESAVRNTQDVDILIRRADFERAKSAFESAGFVHGSTMDVEFFLDGPNAKVRDAVHVLMANEKVKPGYESPSPDVDESHRGQDFRVVELQPLVEMKLNSWRDKDRMHLRDLIELGLIDDEWPKRFAPQLATRLQELLDDPEG